MVGGFRPGEWQVAERLSATMFVFAREMRGRISTSPGEMESHTEEMVISVGDQIPPKDSGERRIFRTNDIAKVKAVGSATRA